MAQKCSDPFEIAVRSGMSAPLIGRAVSMYLDAVCSGDAQQIAREGERLRRVCQAHEDGYALASAGVDYGVLEGNRPYADWIARELDLWADPMLYAVVPGDVVIVRDIRKLIFSEGVVAVTTGRHVYVDAGGERIQFDLWTGLSSAVLHCFAWTCQRWMRALDMNEKYAGRRGAK